MAKRGKPTETTLSKRSTQPTRKKAAASRKKTANKAARTRTRPAGSGRAQGSTSEASPRTVSSRRPSKPAASQPTYEEIAVRAYQLYLQRIRGDALDDWLRAEDELRKG